MIRRHLSAFFLGLLALAILLPASGQFAQALKADDLASAARSSSTESPDIAAFNLGDCLRDTDRRNWPPAYVLICTDLNATQIDAATALVKHDAPSPRVGKQATAVPAVTPVGRVEIGKLPVAPIPMARPMIKTIAAVRKTTTTPAVASLPACVIDERGGTTILNTPPRKIPPQLVTQNSRSRATGIALLVPAACGVKSPMKAKVLFAGDFKGYRGVVILDLPSKRRLIVAGLDALRVKRGDAVERGTFLGSTLPAGAPALVTGFNASMDQNHSLLFFDLRNSKGSGLNVFWLADAG